MEGRGRGKGEESHLVEAQVREMRDGWVRGSQRGRGKSCLDAERTEA